MFAGYPEMAILKTEMVRQLHATQNDTCMLFFGSETIKTMGNMCVKGHQPVIKKKAHQYASLLLISRRMDERVTACHSYPGACHSVTMETTRTDMASCIHVKLLKNIVVGGLMIGLLLDLHVVLEGQHWVLQHDNYTTHKTTCQQLVRDKNEPYTQEVMNMVESPA